MGRRGPAKKFVGGQNSINLPVVTRMRIETLAQRQGTSFSEVVRQALEEKFSDDDPQRD